MLNTPIWAVEIIKSRIGDFKPRLAIVLGSGLGEVAKKIQNAVTISYDSLPYFNTSKIEGHNGRLTIGLLHNVPVVCLEGRTHIYEGGNASEVIKNIVRTLKLIGCKMLLTTCAVGSLNLESPPGSLVLIKDHINFLFTNPLIGPNDERFGDRFVSLDNAYDKDLRGKILTVAKKLDIQMPEGVYLATSGPSFETHAEIRAFKVLGADVVGMSNVPEVIIARHCGLKVASICAVTNFAAGLSSEVLSHEGTIKGAKMAVDKLASIIFGFVKNLK